MVRLSLSLVLLGLLLAAATVLAGLGMAGWAAGWLLALAGAWLACTHLRRLPGLLAGAGALAVAVVAIATPGVLIERQNDDAVAWRTAPDERVVLVAHGVAVTVDGDGRSRGRDADTGAELWRDPVARLTPRASGNERWGHTADDAIHSAGDSAAVTALADGERLSSAGGTGGDVTLAPVASDHTYAISQCDLRASVCNVVALDLRTGRVRWTDRTALSGALLGAPRPAASGRDQLVHADGVWPARYALLLDPAKGSRASRLLDQAIAGARVRDLDTGEIVLRLGARRADGRLLVDGEQLVRAVSPRPDRDRLRSFALAPETRPWVADLVSRGLRVSPGTERTGSALPLRSGWISLTPPGAADTAPAGRPDDRVLLLDPRDGEIHAAETPDWAEDVSVVRGPLADDPARTVVLAERPRIAVADTRTGRLLRTAIDNTPGHEEWMVGTAWIARRVADEDMLGRDRDAVVVETLRGGERIARYSQAADGPARPAHRVGERVVVGDPTKGDQLVLRGPA